MKRQYPIQDSEETSSPPASGRRDDRRHCPQVIDTRIEDLRPRVDGRFLPGLDGGLEDRNALAVG
jgi:hypothetical protein